MLKYWPKFHGNRTHQCGDMHTSCFCSYCQKNIISRPGTFLNFGPKKYEDKQEPVYCPYGQVMVWVHMIIGVRNDLSPKMPLWKNKLIPMISDNKIIKRGHNKQIRYLEQCYSNDILMSLIYRTNTSSIIYMRVFLNKSLGNQITLLVKGGGNTSQSQSFRTILDIFTYDVGLS